MMYEYTDNPDQVVNDNGKKKISWLNTHEDMTVVNGLWSGEFKFDSKFTYYIEGNVAHRTILS